MGVNLCTGPIRKEELQAVMLDGELELWGGHQYLCSIDEWCPC